MKKTIIGLFIVLNLHAVSYEVLLEQAIKNNIQLQIIENKQESLSLQGQIETRFENPNLEMEIADFSSKRLLRENAFGTRVGITQSLLLPSVKKDRKRLTLEKVKLSKQNHRLKKSDFIYTFNVYYLAYQQAFKREHLQEDNVAIVKKVLSIVKQRFDAGSIPKSELFQAKVAYREALTIKKFLKSSRSRKKDELLVFGKLDLATKLEEEHQFFKSSKKSLHPLLALSEQKEHLVKAELKLASHVIKSIDVFSEIEVEPNEEIFRVGVSIPLGIFNKKSQEKQLAKIAKKNEQLFRNSQIKSLKLELEKLENEIFVQSELQKSYDILLAEQEELLSMYEQGYVIAKVNLLKLNQAKKDLLSYREKRLESAFHIEKNIIKINYLQGAYNE